MLPDDPDIGHGDSGLVIVLCVWNHRLARGSQLAGATGSQPIRPNRSINHAAIVGFESYLTGVSSVNVS